MKYTNTKTGERYEFKEALAPTPCPCGGTFSAGYEGERGAVLHSWPPCDAFNRMDVVNFMRWTRGAPEEV